jgi:hypothetical protein
VLSIKTTKKKPGAMLVYARVGFSGKISDEPAIQEEVPYIQVKQAYSIKREV